MTYPTEDRESSPSLWSNPLVIGGLLVVAILVVMVLANFFIGNGVRSKQYSQERGLTAEYPNAQNMLSDCMVRIRESAGVATANSEAVDRVLSDAIKGRYDGGTSASGAVGEGKLFSALKEAYPDISSVSKSFNDVMIVVNDCRTNFRDEQSKLLDMINEYTSYMSGSFFARHYTGEKPSNRLEAQIGDKVVATGPAALKKMRQVIVVSSAQKGYTTGTIEAEQPFATTTTAG